MVKKSDIKRLMNKKKLKGDQVGRLLLYNLLDQVELKPERVSVEEINNMMENLENRYEGLVYNTYVNIYAEVVDAYNSIQSEAVNATLGLTNIKMNLALLARSAISRKAQLQEPVLITERQFRRYETKYRKFLKDTVKQFKEEKVLIGEYLNGRLESIADELEAYDDEEEHPYIAKVLASYSQELISSKWEAILRKIYRKNTTDWNNKHVNPVEIIRELTDEKNIVIFDMKYQEAIEKYAKEHNLKESYINIVVDLKALTNRAKYSLNMTEEEIFDYVNKHSPLDLEKIYFSGNSKDDPELPKVLTKWDALKYFLFETWMNDEEKNQIIKFDCEELSEIYFAVIKELIHEYPAMKELFDAEEEIPQQEFTDEYLNKELTGAQLAKAGDKYYKDMTSITSLRKEHDFGIWNVFPKRIKNQAILNGFAVYHSDSPRNQVTAHIIEKSPDRNNELFMDEFKSLSDNANSLKKSYQTIEAYLKKYQAYSAFIDGIATYAHLDDLLVLKGTPEHRKVLDEIKNVSLMFNLELSQLEAILDEKEFKKQAKKLKETYPIIDPDKPRIKKSSNSALASYIGRVFAVDNKKPVITSVLFDDIAEGVNDDE